MDADLRPRRSEESLGDLVHDATQHAQTMLRDEMALARMEVKEDVRQAVAGIALFSAAGVTALLAVLMLSVAAALGVGTAIGEGWAWLGFVIVGVVYLLIAGGSALAGKEQAEEIPPPAPRTTRQAQRTAAAVKDLR